MGSDRSKVVLMIGLWSKVREENIPRQFVLFFIRLLLRRDGFLEGAENKPGVWIPIGLNTISF